jgi:hypothetical protein
MNPRLRVVLPGLLLGTFWSVLCWGGTSYPFAMLLGPLAMPIGLGLDHPGYSESRMWVEAAILVALILAHPIRPKVLTGVLSAVGLFLWFFVALLYLSDGC